MLHDVRSGFAIAALGLLALTGACSRVEASPSPSATAGPSAASPGAQGAVQSIAFVDQEEACDCTHKRIDDTWAALQTAMKQSRQVPVQRIHRDTQPNDLAPLLAKRKIVTVPAVYLLDGSGEVIDLMQGELTDKELAAALR